MGEILLRPAVKVVRLRVVIPLRSAFFPCLYQQVIPAVSVCHLPIYDRCMRPQTHQYDAVSSIDPLLFPSIPSASDVDAGGSFGVGARNVS